MYSGITAEWKCRNYKLEMIKFNRKTKACIDQSFAKMLADVAL